MLILLLSFCQGECCALATMSLENCFHLSDTLKLDLYSNSIHTYTCACANCWRSCLYFCHRLRPAHTRAYANCHCQSSNVLNFQGQRRPRPAQTSAGIPSNHEGAPRSPTTVLHAQDHEWRSWNHQRDAQPRRQWLQNTEEAPPQTQNQVRDNWAEELLR